MAYGAEIKFALPIYKSAIFLKVFNKLIWGCSDYYAISQFRILYYYRQKHADRVTLD